MQADVPACTLNLMHHGLASGSVHQCSTAAPMQHLVMRASAQSVSVLLTMLKFCLEMLASWTDLLPTDTVPVWHQGAVFAILISIQSLDNQSSAGPSKACSEGWVCLSPSPPWLGRRFLRGPWFRRPPPRPPEAALGRPMRGLFSATDTCNAHHQPVSDFHLAISILLILHAT